MSDWWFPFPVHCVFSLTTAAGDSGDSGGDDSGGDDSGGDGSGGDGDDSGDSGDDDGGVDMMLGGGWMNFRENIRPGADGAADFTEDFTAIILLNKVLRTCKKGCDQAGKFFLCDFPADFTEDFH